MKTTTLGSSLTLFAFSVILSFAHSFVTTAFSSHGRSLQNSAYSALQSQVQNSTFTEASLDSVELSSTKHYVRKAKYMELGYVVDILIDAFYNPSDIIEIRPYLYLSELSRLKGNFPYNEDEHMFFVACTLDDKNNEKIIGFVDVNISKPRKESDAPRPYLSDLAVHLEYRRQGVAKSLIRQCEQQSIAWGRTHLYLRVDEKNDGALLMYSSLDYKKQDHHYFGKGRDTTILLKRDFQSREKEVANDKTVEFVPDFVI